MKAVVDEAGGIVQLSKAVYDALVDKAYQRDGAFKRMQESLEALEVLLDKAGKGEKVLVKRLAGSYGSAYFVVDPDKTMSFVEDFERAILDEKGKAKKSEERVESEKRERHRLECRLDRIKGMCWGLKGKWVGKLRLEELIDDVIEVTRY